MGRAGAIHVASPGAASVVASRRGVISDDHFSWKSGYRFSDVVDELQGKKAMAGPPTDLRSLSRSFTELAIRTLAGIAQHSENDSARVSACGLDRGWGKAPTTFADDENGSVHVVIRHIIEGRDQSPLLDVMPADAVPIGTPRDGDD